MRIAVATSGRFHALDLARELDRLGHQVAFHSIVPPWRTRRFGLPARCNRWLGVPLAALYGSLRFMPHLERPFIELTDRALARRIERCDVLIAISGICTSAVEKIRERFGAAIVIDRGSRHILSQREILDALPGGARVADWSVERELADYAHADLISVPSKHVARSFVERGVDEARLFRNRYGVDLEMFAPTPAPPPEARPCILHAGAWSLRKGCDLLTSAWRKLPGVELLHVGPIGDAPLPSEPGFAHHDAVDQPELRRFYARGHVLALPSREEGLALVQLQALACGVPLVCSERTGGGDLRELAADAVREVPVDDADALAEALALSLERARTIRGTRDLLGGARAQLSWRAYGERWDAELRRRFGARA